MAENPALSETANLSAALAHGHAGGWSAYCTDCDTWSGPLKNRRSALFWPQPEHERGNSGANE